jgi:hypothetical protein
MKFIPDVGMYSKMRFALSISLSLTWGYFQNLLKDFFRKKL